MTISNVILIVDDDPAIRDSLSKELRATGYGTTTAADGSEGMSAFQSQVPDLVLTDLAMPRSDGFELIAAIRASSRVPIVVLSVRGADPDKVRALDLGADDFVTKPFSMAELLARVRAQLRRTAPASTTLAFHDLTIELDRDERRQTDVHRTDHRPRLALGPQHQRRHSARPHELSAQEDRAEPVRTAIHRDGAVGRLPVHRGTGVRKSPSRRLTR
jgi:DNA-binding response OmpR family regulator